MVCAVGKIYMVCVIIALGKNCREESDKVFAIGYQVCKGSDSNPTYLDSLVERPSTPFSVHNQHRLVCHDLWPLSVFEVKGRCHGLQH